MAPRGKDTSKRKHPSLCLVLELLAFTLLTWQLPGVTGGHPHSEVENSEFAAEAIGTAQGHPQPHCLPF